MDSDFSVSSSVMILVEVIFTIREFLCQGPIPNCQNAHAQTVTVYFSLTVHHLTHPSVDD